MSIEQLYTEVIQNSTNYLLSNPSLYTQTDIDNYTTYCGNSLLTNPNYDCAEIAEDLVTLLKTSTVLEIKPKGKNGFATFTVLEWGQVQQYVNHFVAVKNGLVFDPRFSRLPIPVDYYIQFLTVTNPRVKLSIKTQEW